MKKKLLAISSGGGHWVQLLRLRPAFEECDVVYATVKEGYRSDVGSCAFHTVPNANRWDKIGMIKCALSILFLLLRERPDIVISTGAAVGFFGVRLAKCLGMKTIWVDSIANAEELSLSGQKAGQFVDLWLTQWEHLSQSKGPQFFGNVL
ncbi:MAG: UDP-N-acetylglucosamine--LPS N-acetylglucosamine transferase [Akkermansiaceae bacterium]